MSKKKLGLICATSVAAWVRGAIGGGFDYATCDEGLWANPASLNDFLQTEQPHLLILDAQEVSRNWGENFDLRSFLEKFGVPYLIFVGCVEWRHMWFGRDFYLGFPTEDISPAIFLSRSDLCRDFCHQLICRWLKPLKVLYVSATGNIGRMAMPLVLNGIRSRPAWIEPWKIFVPPSAHRFNYQPAAFLCEHTPGYDVVVVDPTAYHDYWTKRALDDCGLPYWLHTFLEQPGEWRELLLLGFSAQEASKYRALCGDFGSSERPCSLFRIRLIELAMGRHLPR